MLIIRKGPPYYEIILEILEKRIPKQQVFYCTKNGDCTIETLQEKVKYAPVFGAYYLIKIDGFQKDKSFWKLLKTLDELSFVRIVLMCNKSDDFRNALVLAEQSTIKTKIFDSYKTSKETRDRYIRDKLIEYNPEILLSKEDIQLIRKRLFGYASEVNGFLHQLSKIEINRKSIMKTIPNRDRVNSGNFGYQVYHGLPYNLADDVIQRYRYYPTALINSLYNYTVKVHKLYRLFLKGEFTEVNYAEFYAERGTDFKLSSEFDTVEILKLFERIPIENIIYIESVLDNAGESRLKDIIILYNLTRRI